MHAIVGGMMDKLGFRQGVLACCNRGMPWLGALCVAARMKGNIGLEQFMHACMLEGREAKM